MEDPVQSWQLPQTYSSRIGSVRWAQLGDPAAAPLVLLHGTPFSSFIWRHIARALAHDHCVYVWDMPGYGASDKHKGQDLSLDALAEVFTGLLDHWSLDEPMVVAHDSGGAVALGAQLRHGARYSRLGLVDAVSLAPWGSPFFQLVGEHAALFDNLPARLHQALLREYVNTASSPGLHPATLESLIGPWTDDAGQAAFYHQLQQRTADEGFVEAIQDDYQTIDIPVAICWGEDDTWIPPGAGARTRRADPGSEFSDHPGRRPPRTGGQPGRANCGTSDLPLEPKFALTVGSRPRRGTNREGQSSASAVSMSPGVLYRCGENRMRPRRWAAYTPAARRRSYTSPADPCNGSSRTSDERTSASDTNRYRARSIPPSRRVTSSSMWAATRSTPISSPSSTAAVNGT